MTTAASGRADPDPDLTPAERQALLAWVRERGEVAACAEIGVSRQTLGRGIAGLDLQHGTIVLLRQRLATRAR